MLSWTCPPNNCVMMSFNRPGHNIVHVPQQRTDGTGSVTQTTTELWESEETEGTGTGKDQNYFIL